MLWPDKLDSQEPMQLRFALVRIIYDTITSVSFWAYDFSLCMIFLSVWIYVSMICVHMIFLGVWFFLSIWVVCEWFFCVYDLCVYDFSVRLIFITMLLFLSLTVRTRINGQYIQTSWISASENKESFYSLLHLLGGVHLWSDGQGSENGAHPPDPMHSPKYIGHFPISPWWLIIHYGIHCWLDTFSAYPGH